MKNNNMGSYLKYAFGEIILVMIGILLALQVNTWNENRKDRNKEKALLKELHKDFKKNLEGFEPIKQLQINTLKSGNIVFRNIDKLHLPKSRDSIFRHADNMFGGYPYNPSNGVVESLLSTGDINLIRNDTLRKYLVSWKDVLTHYTDFVEVDLNFWSQKIEPYIIENGNFMDISSDKNKAMLTDPIFINMLVRKQHFQQNIVNSMGGNDGLEHYMKEIVRLSESSMD